MTDLIGPTAPGPAEAGSEAQQHRGEPAAEPKQHDSRQLDRRQQNRWVPRLASLIALVVGLTFIIIGIRPALYQQLHFHLHSRLHRLAGATPFTLGLTAELSRLAIVVIGLLMLSHGLRRRKRRAWEQTMALLGLAGVLDIIRLQRYAVTYGEALQPDDVE